MADALKIVAVVQARLGSTRLPGKILLPIAGRPMLAHVIAAAQSASQVDECWVACPDGVEDDPVAKFAASHDVRCHRGSGPDVLARFVETAAASEADVVVRLTADCPLLDPAVIDRVVASMLERPGTSYASNTLRRTYPRGLDTEAMSVDALSEARRVARTTAEHEHVTVLFRGSEGARFAPVSVEAEIDDSDLRWTVDTADDLEYVNRLRQTTSSRDYRTLVAVCRTQAGLYREDREGTTWDPIGATDPIN